MLSLIKTALTVVRRLRRVHVAALHKPLEHKALLAGHTLELLAIAVGLLDYTLVEHVTGVAGAACLLWHVCVNEV